VAFLAFVLSLLIAALGALGMVAPRALVAVATTFGGAPGLLLATALRLALGAALWVAAPRSRAPLLFRALGAAFLFVGALTPLMGVARYDAAVAWFAAQSALTTRVWAAGAAIVGLLIAYGVIPREAR
jgi:hypothetical protein